MGTALLASALHVTLHELLGVLLEDVVDFVQELVDVFLDLLALLGKLGTTRSPIATVLGGLGRSCFLLFLFRHDALRASVDPAAPHHYLHPIVADGTRAPPVSHARRECLPGAH